MKARVRLAVTYGDATDVKELTLEVSDKITLGALWGILAREHGGLLDVPVFITVAPEVQPYSTPNRQVRLQKRPLVRQSTVTILSSAPDAQAASRNSPHKSARTIPLSETAPLLVDGFDFPVGKPDGKDYYIAAGVAEQPYYQRFGLWHTGEDWNGPGGGDSDLGAPVFVTAHGRVIASDYFRPSWGNVILVEHHLPGEQKVWSQYAHLREVFVGVGQWVRRGQQIGTIGKGHNNEWPAHLHFELRRRERQ